MPYNNPYNQKIADELYQQDEDLIKHLNRESETPLFLRGSGSSGGRMNIEDKYIENVLTGGCMNCGCQPNMNNRVVGGTGYGKATLKDDGFGKELGLGTVDFFKPSKNSKGGVKKMEKEDSKICYVGVGSGTKELKDDLGKFDFNRVKDWVGLGKHLKLTGKGWAELQKDLRQYDMNRIKDYVGLGKYGKANSKRMSGSGWWDSFTGFFTDTIPNIAKQSALGLKNASNMISNDVRNLIGVGKKKKGEGVSGGKAKRAEIVKKVMKDKGLSMIDASKFVKEHNLY